MKNKCKCHHHNMTCLVDHSGRPCTINREDCFPCCGFQPTPKLEEEIHNKLHNMALNHAAKALQPPFRTLNEKVEKKNIFDAKEITIAAPKVSTREGCAITSVQCDCGKKLVLEIKYLTPPKKPESKGWKRYRFYTYSVDDYRPLIFNPKHPWWCTGYGWTNGDPEKEYAIIVIYLPAKENLKKYWPDAFDIEFTEEDEIKFSGRFPKPEYFKP